MTSKQRGSFNFAASFPVGLLFFSVSGLAQAGPWVHNQGSHYTKASYGAYVSEGARSATGSLDSGVEYLGQTAALYAEVGVATSTQLTLWLPYVVARNQVPGTPDPYFTAGVADAIVGVERGALLGGGEVPVSMRLATKLPLYDQSELEEGYPTLGDGQLDLQAGVSAGHGWSLGSVRGWGSTALGYTYRSVWGFGPGPIPFYGNGLTYHAQIGLNPRWGGREIGWLNADASGLASRDDGWTKSFHQASLGGALRLSETVALEGSYTRVYAAVAMGTAHAISLGLSHSL